MPTSHVVPPAELRESDRRFAAAVVSSYKSGNWDEESVVSVVADSLRLVRKIATKYTDNSCMELHYDDLEAAGRHKLVDRLQAGVLEKFDPERRGELFAHLKACLNNYIKSIVFRCRFTPKRMGRSVPTKNSGLDYDRSFKPEVSLDDPDASSVLQRAASGEGDRNMVDNDMAEILTPAEYMVYAQLTAPNDGAMLMAWLDGCRGPRERSSVEVSHENMAAGLGLSLTEFSRLTDSVRAKFSKYRSERAEMIESTTHHAIAAVEAAFDIQIPRSTDAATVARAVTIAARINHEKVTPELADLIKLTGGRAPEKDPAGNLACYGILWQQNNRACLQCSAYTQCKQAANQVGLGSLDLPSTLFSGKAAVRVAMAASVPESDKEVPAVDTSVPMTTDENKLKTFVESHFRGANFGTDRYYRNPAKKQGEKVRYIFWLGRKDGALRLRFCKPSEKLQAKLDQVGRMHYLPTNITWAAAERLIKQHSDETED